MGEAGREHAICHPAALDGVFTAVAGAAAGAGAARVGAVAGWPGRRAAAGLTHAARARCRTLTRCSTFTLNRERAVDFLNQLERLYVTDGYACWHPAVRYRVRVVCARPYHALFAHNMLIRCGCRGREGRCALAARWHGDARSCLVPRRPARCLCVAHPLMRQEPLKSPFKNIREEEVTCLMDAKLGFNLK